MHKHYFGIASIIFSSACLIWSIGQATAIPMGPSVSTGSIPYESFSNSIPNSSVQTLLTVPADKVFIVTTCIDYRGALSIEEDSSSMLNNYTYACLYTNASSFTQGNAHLIINSNSSLNVRNNSGYTSYYYIEGYYAQP